MEKRRSFFAGTDGFLWSLLLLLLFGCTTAAPDKYPAPTKNVNLAPFQKWRNVYECIYTGFSSGSCSGNFSLTETGRVNVTDSQKAEYCTPNGCADHARAVIWCLSLVKPDYKFWNGAKLKDINYTINHGCSQNFTGSTMFISAGKIHDSKTMAFISVIAAWLFLAINM